MAHNNLEFNYLGSSRDAFVSSCLCPGCVNFALDSRIDIVNHYWREASTPNLRFCTRVNPVCARSSGFPPFVPYMLHAGIVIQWSNIWTHASFYVQTESNTLKKPYMSQCVLLQKRFMASHRRHNNLQRVFVF